MGRAAKGNHYESRGRFYARVSLGGGVRPHIPLPTCTTDEAAAARAQQLAELAQRLKDAGQRGDLAKGLLERAGARDGKALADVVAAIAAVCKGDARAMQKASTATDTFQSVAERWTSGELARTYPDHVKKKSSATEDIYRLQKHVYGVIGAVPIAAFAPPGGLDRAEAVMRALGSSLGPGGRRQVAQLVHRVLSLCVFPLRLLPANPLPKGWLPSPGPRKALAHLYPDEDAKLLACTAVPLCRRMLYGFLAREGTRRGEAFALDRGDIDLGRGALTLDENKTDDPRAWALDRGVAVALERYFALRGELAPDAPVFVNEEGRRIRDEHLAETFRADLRTAGISRAQLFEQSAARRRIRAHDLRATFITLSLANGRTEAWVQDRTGHESSDMINRYRRAARTVAELGLGELRSLAEAIPELVGPSGGPSDEKAGQDGAGAVIGGGTGDANETEETEAALSVQKDSPREGGGIGRRAGFRFSRPESDEARNRVTAGDRQDAEAASGAVADHAANLPPTGGADLDPRLATLFGELEAAVLHSDRAGGLRVLDQLRAIVEGWP